MGKLAFSFWGGTVCAGIVVPASVGFMSLLGSALPSGKIMLLNSVTLCIAGLIGGLTLRHIVVAGGVKAPIYVEGVVVPVSSQG
jgi:formate-dependent nitrite reductase membrane component NrfD